MQKDAGKTSKPGRTDRVLPEFFIIPPKTVVKFSVTELLGEQVVSGMNAPAFGRGGCGGGVDFAVRKMLPQLRKAAVGKGGC